ncbi:hypothetical protein Tsubulata_018159 [Turnera subulata]|uniref:RING-type domain-containing protein n=1 Tax=Turnera subulata TaxID=218843 RepID=A0A9Q0G294_9ROSI|nr:hypothetical protein Tsubulata_018159 [Turnera subulata]
MKTLLSLMLLVVSCLKWIWLSILDYLLSFREPSGYPEFITQRSGGEDVDDYCVVCMCLIGEDEEATRLRCEHIFHRVCLDRWFAAAGYIACPICRDGDSGYAPEYPLPSSSDDHDDDQLK